MALPEIPVGGGRSRRGQEPAEPTLRKNREDPRRVTWSAPLARPVRSHSGPLLDRRRQVFAHVVREGPSEKRQHARDAPTDLGVPLIVEIPRERNLRLA